MNYHGFIFSARAYPTERSSGSHRIATFLRTHAMDVEVVDFASHWHVDQLKVFVQQNIKPTTIFFAFSTFFNHWNQTLQKLVNWMKREYPHIKVVLGGQQVIATHAKNIDIWVDSYGELAMLEIAKSLAGNTTAGLKFDFETFGTTKVIKSLQAYPAYNLGDYSIIMQDRDFLQPYEWLTIEFSRGCKFSCTFCNFPVLGVKEDTSRTQESFEREMKYNYDNYGITNYYVADETFNDRVEKITKFADVVEKLNFTPFYSGFVRADLFPANMDMVPEMARMNFGGQYYGIETFNHQSGKVIGKGMDPERVKETLITVKDYMLKNAIAYRGNISLIVGLPYDTRAQWDLNIEWLKNHWNTESIVIFPLDVEDLETNAASNYTNVSKFSKNLQKYGLRKMGTEKDNKAEYFKVFKTGFEWRHGHFVDHKFLWEHDTMNIFEAREIAYEVQDLLSDRKTDTWQLHNAEFNLGRKEPNLQPLFNEKKSESEPTVNAIARHLDNYITKKLNK